MRCVTITLTEENAAQFTDEQLLDELEDNGCCHHADSPIKEVVENERLNIEVTDTTID
jgi:hypothetical protein